MPGYNVKVSIRRGEMYLGVDYGLTGAGHPHLFLRSSASSAPVLDDRSWSVGLPWSVTDRLRGGGDEKGRVLGVWQELPGAAPVPLAALAWHAHGTGPLYVFDLDRRENLRRALGLSFAKHEPPPAAARWTKGAWLGERTF